MKLLRQILILVTILVFSISLQGKSEVIEKSFTIEPGKPVMVNFKGVDGDLVIEKSDKNEIFFKFKKELRGSKSRRNLEYFEKIKPEMSFNNNRLFIEIKIPRRKVRLFEFFRGPGIRITSRLFVPAKSDLKVKVVDGDVNVSDIKGDIEVSSVDGDLKVYGCEGTLDIDSTDGDITVDDCQGSLKCHTVDGDIETQGIFQEFYVRTTDGDCILALEKGSRLVEDSMVQTVDGDVQIEMPADFNFKLKARASDGRISLHNLELDQIIRKKKNRLEGERGKADFVIEIKTTDGDILIRER